MAVSVVQTQDAAGAGSPTTLNFAGNVAIGNSVVVWIGDYNTSGAAISSSAPTYNGGSVTGATKLFGLQGSSNGSSNEMYIAVWLLPNVQSSGTSVAISTTNANADGNSRYFIAEVAGLGTAPAVDSASPNPATGISTGAGGGTVTSGATGNAVASPGIVLGGMMQDGSTGWTGPGGWTTISTSNLAGASYQVFSSSGSSYTWTETGSSPVQWAAGAVILDATPSAATPVPAAAPGRTWKRRFKHRQAPPFTSTFSIALSDSGTGTDTFAAGNVSVPLPALPGRAWLRQFKHRQTCPYPPQVASATPVALSDSGTGTDVFSAGNVSVPLPALPGRVWLRQFKHRQSPLYSSTVSVDLADSGSGSDSFAAGNVSVPLPALPGRTWIRGFKHRQSPLYTSTFSEDFTESGSGTDVLAPGIATAYPFPPATPGRTWQRRFKHRQSPPYIPVQPGQVAIGLTDSGAGTDTFAASILTQLPLPPALPGRAWQRKYKHRQQPLYTSVFSVDLADSGAGTDSLAPGIATAYPFPPAVAGKTWQRQFKHRQAPLYTSTFSRDLTDSGSGTDVFSTVITGASPLYLSPGKTWKRRYKHRQAYPVPARAPAATQDRRAAFLIFFP